MRYIVTVLFLANIAALLWFQFGPSPREAAFEESTPHAPAPLINTGLLKIGEREP
jgi:hypothetical protein